MSDYSPRQHALILLTDFSQTLEQSAPFNSDPLGEDEASFMDHLQRIVEGLKSSDESIIFEGQSWLTRLFRNYPVFAPHLGREVLWFFGGEALHFMPDEEIEKFQRLDDMVAEGADYLETKKDIFKAH